MNDTPRGRDSRPLLFSPFTVRGVTFPNRVVLAPMVHYRAREGICGTFHTVHLGKFALGGFGYVVWGVAVRVCVGVTGHWLVGHFAHRAGPMTWRVRNASVQGHNLPWAAILSMGESWHNNHHAFPGSARLGLARGQCDPGWRLIQLLRMIGLAWNIRTPETLPPRPELERLSAA